MCGIIGVFGKEEAFEIVCAGLERMQERGRDGAGLFDGKSVQYANSPKALKNIKVDHIIGHVLHSVVGKVYQPILSEDSAIAANCEIYNWKELAKTHAIEAKNDSELLIKLFDQVGVEKALPMLRGVYAFCYWSKGKVYLARDIIGIKPLWYSVDGGFGFSSERKAIQDRFNKIDELNPRKILIYDTNSHEIDVIERDFFGTVPEIEDEKDVLEQIREKLSVSVNIRIPERKFGLLFSGGLDSIIIARLLQGSGKKFSCYTAAVSEHNQDLVAAREAAKVLGLELKEKIVALEETKKYLEKIVPLIEDSNVMKVGVALPLYVASEMAREDGCKVIFSGGGADELFAGYFRYKNQKSLKNLNIDCLSDVRKIYERNTYRDDVVTMNNNLELRVPFLDVDVVRLALRIAPQLKIHRTGQEQTDKYILREFAKSLDIPESFAMRPKKAAQYGSGFDKAIAKLTKEGGYSYKSGYLDSLFRKKNVRLAALVSTGKDGLLAAHIMKKQNYDISCLVTIASKNPDSYMFHTPNVWLAKLQAEAMAVPIVFWETEGEKEKELDDLFEALKKAKEKFDVEGIVSGAIYSNYQRQRIEKIADSLGLKIFSPLWHIDQEQEMQELLAEGFEFVMQSVAAYGLDKGWLGKRIGKDEIDKLAELEKKYKLNIAGEGGEYESLVLDCPLFIDHKIEILSNTLKEEDQNTARMIVEEARLVDKKRTS